MSGEPDPKNRPRIKDPALMRLMHYEGGTCALADETCEPGFSLHHIYPRAQGGDDVRANLAILCGSGTTGHHGKMHAKDPETLAAFYGVLRSRRSDTLAYLSGRLGDAGRASEWISRTFLR